MDRLFYRIFSFAILTIFIGIAALSISGCSDTVTTNNNGNPHDSDTTKTSKGTYTLSFSGRGNWKLAATPTVLYDTVFHTLEFLIESDSAETSGAAGSLYLTYSLPELAPFEKTGKNNGIERFEYFKGGGTIDTIRWMQGVNDFHIAITKLDRAAGTISLSLSSPLSSFYLPDTIGTTLTLTDARLIIVPSGPIVFNTMVNDSLWPRSGKLGVPPGEPYELYYYNHEEVLHSLIASAEKNGFGQPDRLDLDLMPLVQGVGSYTVEMPKSGAIPRGTVRAAMSISRPDIDQFGGQVRFDVKEGEGSTFTMDRFDRTRLELDATFTFKMYEGSIKKWLIVSGQIKNMRWKHNVFVH